ncbi:MAG: LemA family protein [Clostridia bacterium]|nr:LemA family protein [Clostridia bacterium]
MILYVVIAVIVVLVIYLIVQYNGFVKTNNMVKEAFSTMDVYLKKRWDLIPNLVEVVKGYAKHEKETLNQITSLRTNSYDSMPMDKKINVNQQLGQGITKIIAIAENYPELKANENFAKLSAELLKIEDEIANSRKYYNGAVRKLNNKIQMFPSNIVAGMFKFKQANMFEVNTEERDNVKVSL